MNRFNLQLIYYKGTIIIAHAIIKETNLSRRMIKILAPHDLQLFFETPNLVSSLLNEKSPLDNFSAV